MKVKILSEHGYDEALFGIGLSYGLTSKYELDELKHCPKLRDRLIGIAHKLANANTVEGKFLRQISILLDIDAPWFFWKQFDTYKVGTTAQSESTMHTIMHHEFTPDMFEKPNASLPLHTLNALRERYYLADTKEEKEYCWTSIIGLLPSSFLQRRIVSLNYAVLKQIIFWRHNHKLKQWHYFCEEILKNIKNPELLEKENDLFMANR